MDKTDHLGKTTFLRSNWLALPRLIGLFWLTSLAGCAASAAETDQPEQQPAWVASLHQALKAADEAHSGELGVYVKDLASGISVSLRAEEPWYLASGVKVPVAIAVLREVEKGNYPLKHELMLAESDFVDGAGQINWQRPGSALRVDHLIEQMLTVSDNTASDMLIRFVGIDEVNQLVRELVPEGFGLITTLADVRRHAYSGFHPDAFKLTGRDFFAIREQREERLRIEVLAGILGVEVVDFAMTDLDSAFAAYYATNLNGGQLSAYGDLLEALVNDEALGPVGTDYLLNVLFATKTGAGRIKAQLPTFAAFAHKTGTQHRRACDLGVVMNKSEQAAVADAKPGPDAQSEARSARPGVVIAACSREFATLASAEAQLRDVGEAVTKSGLLEALK